MVTKKPIRRQIGKYFSWFTSAAVKLEKASIFPHKVTGDLCHKLCVAAYHSLTHVWSELMRTW